MSNYNFWTFACLPAGRSFGFYLSLEIAHLSLNDRILHFVQDDNNRFISFACLVVILLTTTLFCVRTQSPFLIFIKEAAIFSFLPFKICPTIGFGLVDNIFLGIVKHI